MQYDFTSEAATATIATVSTQKNEKITTRKINKENPDDDRKGLGKAANRGPKQSESERPEYLLVYEVKSDTTTTDLSYKGLWECQQHSISPFRIRPTTNRFFGLYFAQPLFPNHAKQCFSVLLIGSLFLLLFFFFSLCLFVNFSECVCFYVGIFVYLHFYQGVCPLSFCVCLLAFCL